MKRSYEINIFTDPASILLMVFFADITFPIYYLHHMVLDTTHNYYSLSLILSYPKLVVSLLLIFGIDMYCMFIF
jgi:peptidoglycan/LPS O-acetylase OafA/YrhL